MSTTVTGSGLHIDVARWAECRMPRNEITGALSFLMHKMKKNVRCAPYRGSLQYSADVTSLYVCTAETCNNPVPVDHVKLGGSTISLDCSQMAFPQTELAGEEIKDEEGRVLAKVDLNCVVVLLDITAADNHAGRAILAHVVEKSIPLFNFDVKDRLKERTDTIKTAYVEFHAAAIRSRIDDKTEEVKRLERDAENFYYQLVQAERDLPAAKQELEAIEKQVESKDNALVEKQAAGLLALIANGQYEEITPSKDGTLAARTSNISIEHDDWTFELGRYDITIDASGKVTIFNADGKEADGYPHPHVDSTGRPCLGNISADIARAIGRMRMSESLTQLRQFGTIFVDFRG